MMSLKTDLISITILCMHSYCFFKSNSKSELILPSYIYENKRLKYYLLK